MLRKIAFVLVFVTLSFNGLAQTNEEKLFQELADNACKCIDSIETYNKIKEEIAKEISACIRQQATALQVGVQLLKAAEEAEKTDSKSVTVEGILAENKEYHYAIERYLMENCAAIQRKVSVSDLENTHSYSENPKAKSFYSKGLKAFEKGDFKKAASHYEKAVKEDPMFVFAWDNLGLCYRKLNKLDDAIAAYEKSLSIDPYGVMPLQNLAVAYRFNKEVEKAIATYERLAKIDTNNAETYYGLGGLYAGELSDFEKALDYMCKAYVLYTNQGSPYRSDAEKIIAFIYAEMKKQGKQNKFYEIMKNNGINITEEE